MGRSDKKRGIAVPGQWLPVGLEFLHSRACAELSPHGAKLLLDCLAQLGPNAARNGDICLAPKVMAVRGWTSRASLNAAVKELLAYGLLVQTRQGSRLDCSLFALTIYPLNCDLKKIDLRPGAYRVTDYMADGTLANPPSESRPGVWRHARKKMTVDAPPGNKGSAVRSAAEQTCRAASDEYSSLHRGGTKSSFFEKAIVPPRVTSLDQPSPCGIGAGDVGETV